jgi:DNA-binding NarL/FixJ family response regulator
VRVLILTTFEPDEYVYRALRAGASGFVLKDIPPEQLVVAVRTVADGGALLAPSVTRRLIGQFASQRGVDPGSLAGWRSSRRASGTSSSRWRGAAATPRSPTSCSSEPRP